jgi:CRP-like cAMP-binding protein
MAKDSSSFAPDLWSALEKLTSLRTYVPGSVLFEQGQSASGIFMIQKGQVRLWMPAAAERAKMSTPVSSGTMLALSETISEGTHKFSAMATLPSEAGFVPRAVLMQYLRDHHDVCMQVVKVLSEDLHGLYHKFQSLSAGHRGRRWQPDGIQ